MYATTSSAPSTPAVVSSVDDAMGPVRVMRAYASLDEPAGAEDLQHQLVEGHVRVGAEAGHRARGAELLQFLAVLLVLLLVLAEQLGADGDLARLAGLAVDEREIAVERRIRFLGVDGLDHERL